MEYEVTPETEGKRKTAPGRTGTVTESALKYNRTERRRLLAFFFAQMTQRKFTALNYELVKGNPLPACERTDFFNQCIGHSDRSV